MRGFNPDRAHRRATAAGRAALWVLVVALATASAAAVLAQPLAVADQEATANTTGSAAPWAVADATRQAYSHALPEFQSDAQLPLFQQGRSLFRRAWIDGPVSDGDSRGLGPLYNRLSCIACHAGNGRGQAPTGPDERMQSMLVRLSLPGRAAHGAPRPHPAYGDQLNEEGVPGVPGEGRARLHWQAVPYRLPDGSRLLLRRPQIRFAELAYGPLQGVQVSARVGPGVYGLGLLEAVPEASLVALSQRRQPDGIRGRLNRVWDPVARRMALGRFGWKANVASLPAQVVQAAHGDLGLTSQALPAPTCSPQQTHCIQAAAGSGIELDTPALQALVHYLRSLAPPAARQVGELQIERGRQLFTQLRCAACHRPTLPVAGVQATLEIAAYTDLLLHDMGPGLADHRSDHRAGGRDWRTPPLWGIGLVPVVNEHSEYLHDGRARNLREAIAWHGGEAKRARQRFDRLALPDQQALLAFLASL